LLEKNHNFKGINYIYFPKSSKFMGDISNLDVSNAKDLSFMFFECKKFTANLSN